MKHLIFIITLFISVSAYAAPWLCGNTDVVYDSQNFCSEVCSETCIEMTPNGGTCNGGYKNYAFDRSKNKTYALSINKQKWAASSNQLAIVRDVRANDILKDILSFSGESEAWIGLYDPNMTQSFNAVNDTRFKWRDNTVLNYRNWAEGQPDNKLNPADIGNTDIYGEHYGVMNASGLWSDSGGNVMKNALVEFSGVQPCVSGTVPSELVTPDDMQSAFCGGNSSNCYLCTDSTDIFQCTQGTAGGFLCPKNQQNCNMNYTNVICPTGTTLNPTNDKCEASVTISCPTGMTYDSGLDRCAVPAVCSGGGLLNPVSDKCETVITSGNCPSGFIFDSALDICKSTPKCPTGAIYNSTTDRCEAAVITSCPTGYTYNSNLNKCQANPVCPAGSTYNSTAKKCVINSTINCLFGSFNSLTGKCEFIPSADWVTCSAYLYRKDSCNEKWCMGTYEIDKTGNPGAKFFSFKLYYGSDEYEFDDLCNLTWNRYGYGSITPGNSLFHGDVTIKNKSSKTLSCPSGYLNSKSGKCETQPVTSCSSGYTFDSALGMCVRTPTCNNGGVFNSSTNKCELSVSTSCPTGTTYNASVGKCVSTAVCSHGIYDTALDICKIAASTLCPSGYSYDSTQNKCLKEPLCNQGSYSVTVDKCVSVPAKSCPTGAIQNGNICQADPSCSTGSYSASQNKCFTTSCPINGKPCINVGGVYKCSAHDCYNSTDTGNYQSEDTTEGENDKTADGEFDDAGQCLGTIYIFNGNDRRCRPSGVQTGGTDCCKKKEDWFGLSKCNPNEQALSSLRNWGKKDGQCVDIGSYCSEKWLGICVQRKKTYCCFGTSLARIIAEQGRAQLGIGWGSAKKPECRGFTPEEFQKIDFDKIDFSEWMEHEVNANMKGNMEANIQNAFENISISGVQ